MSKTGLNTVLEAVISSPTLLYHNAKSIHPQQKDFAAVKAGQAHIRLQEQSRASIEQNIKNLHGEDMSYEIWQADEKRWLINDKTDVRKIDSVYRNRDAGLARRGLMKLDKWWDENDETLKNVMGSAVVPRRHMIRVQDGVGPANTTHQGAVEIAA